LTVSTQQRYITKVRIENFQSHEDTEFDLSPGINLIVGSSEAGKSAILRAINFALHNEPRGDDFVRQERDETRVHLWWNDGCYLCRIKGENRNAVLIKDKDGYESGFERIGNSLPPEALAVLGNPPTDDESGPISYADQHQPLFLVTLSASELPKTISRLTGIDDFEDAAELLNKKANSANRQIKDSTKRIESFNEQLKKYNNLDNNLSHLEKMEKISMTIDEISTNVSNANHLKQNFDDLMNMGRRTNAALKDAEKIAILSEKLSPVKDEIKKLTTSRQLANDYATLVFLEGEATNSLQISEIMSGKKCVDLMTESSDIITGISDANKLKNHYDELINRGRAINDGHAIWSETLVNKQDERSQIVVEMRGAGLWCNVCQRPKSMDVCEK